MLAYSHICWFFLFSGISSQFSCSPRIISTPQVEIPISPCAPGKDVFSYTGSTQFFTLPSTCASSPQVFIKMWGAGGGSGGGTDNSLGPGPGGGGCYVAAALALDLTQTYSVFIGQGGQPFNGSNPLGGLNNGGNGAPSNPYASGGGGGRTSFFINGTEELTAGAGGGGGVSGYYSYLWTGGAGGGFSGEDAYYNNSVAGGGGMSNSGGVTCGSSAGTPGSFHAGGTTTVYGGGGGDGYYGGGTGCSPSSGQVSGGGGGSSYISPILQISSSITLSGAETSPGNSTDIDNAGAGLGGTSYSPGADGLVIFYYGAGAIASVSPISGPLAGGTTVMLQGLGFVSGTNVTIAGLTCSNLNIQSVNRLTCLTPPVLSQGAADVVLNVPGAQTATLRNDFIYTP